MFAIEPLTDIQIPPEVAALPKADIHIHPEWSPRLDRVLARRDGRAPYRWQEWSARLMQNEPPGQSRLNHISSHFPAGRDDDTDENFVLRTVDLLDEAAADNALLVEVRLGKDMAYRPGCIELFQQALEQVQAQYPQFQAAAIPFVHLDWPPETVARMLKTCVEWADAKLLYGIDLFNDPYDSEADWTAAYRAAEKLATAGLGLTVHVAETAPVNVEAVLKVPGIRRLGHATHAGYHPHLLESVARSGVTVECALTCNVVLGASASYETHPIKQFAAAGIPIALCTDDPVQVCTTIGREYAIAHALGLTTADLLNCTRNAIQAAFIAPEVREALLNRLPEMG